MMINGMDKPGRITIACMAFRFAGWLSMITAVAVLGIILFGALGVGLNRSEHGLLGSAILGETGILIFVLSALLGIADFMAAQGILRKNRWARITGIALGVLMLPVFPAGTVFGIFILNGLLSKDAGRWFHSP